MWFALVSRRGGADESLRAIQTVAGALFGPIFWPTPPLPPPSSSTNYPPTPQPAKLSGEVAAILNLFPVSHQLPKDAMYAQIFNSSEASPYTH